MKSGDKANVYHDPMSCKNLDSKVTIVRVHQVRPYTDDKGRAIYNCEVKYPDAEDATDTYYRDISEVIG